MPTPTELTDADPNEPARCPRLLMPGGTARCRALVLVRDAAEHGAWHDELAAAFEAPVRVHGGLETAPWPEADEADREANLPGRVTPLEGSGL